MVSVPYVFGPNVYAQSGQIDADFASLSASTLGAVAKAGDTMTGALTVQQAITTSGASAALNFQDRSGSPTWAWYSTGGNARLNNGGDVLIVNNVTGVLTLVAGGMTANGASAITSNSSPQLTITASSTDVHVSLNATRVWQLCSQMASSPGNFLVYDATAPGTRISIDPSGNCAASTAWTVISDATVKTDIEDHHRGLADVLKLRPRRFRYSGAHGFEEGAQGHGLIAQELAEVMPELVRPIPVNTDGDELQGVTETGVIWPLVRAVQELAAKVTALEAQLAAKAVALAILGLASAAAPALAQDIPQSRADIVVNFKNFQNALGEYIQERDQLEARLKWVLDNWVPKPEPPLAKTESK